MERTRQFAVMSPAAAGGVHSNRRTSSKLRPTLNCGLPSSAEFLATYLQGCARQHSNGRRISAPRLPALVRARRRIDGYRTWS